MDMDAWFLIATTPDGMHLWELTAEQVATDEERDAIIAAVRVYLDVPGDPGMVPPDGWSLDLSPGRPQGCFDADGNPLPGVTVHDGLPTG